jgi:transcription initiation factor TFIIH subunit 4
MDGGSKVSVKALDAWARGQWEAILYFMVGTTGSEAAVSRDMARATPSMKTLLSSGGFVVVKGERVNITKEGFTFLLQETHAQVWSLLIVYLNKGEEVSRPLYTRLELAANNLI